MPAVLAFLAFVVGGAVLLIAIVALMVWRSPLTREQLLGYFGLLDHQLDPVPRRAASRERRSSAARARRARRPPPTPTPPPEAPAVAPPDPPPSVIPDSDLPSTTDWQALRPPAPGPPRTRTDR